MTIPDEAIERVHAAIKAWRQGQPDGVRCYFCEGVILVAGQHTVVYTTCPCKKSGSCFKGL